MKENFDPARFDDFINYANTTNRNLFFYSLPILATFSAESKCYEEFH